MKSYVLAAVILVSLVYVVFVTCKSIVFFLSIYSQALDESYCECDSVSPEMVREKVKKGEEVQESELKWIASFFVKGKNYNLPNHFEFLFFCTGTGG